MINRTRTLYVPPRDVGSSGKGKSRVAHRAEKAHPSGQDFLPKFTPLFEAPPSLEKARGQTLSALTYLVFYGYPQDAC